MKECLPLLLPEAFDVEGWLISMVLVNYSALNHRASVYQEIEILKDTAVYVLLTNQKLKGQANALKGGTLAGHVRDDIAPAALAPINYAE